MLRAAICFGKRLNTVRQLSPIIAVAMKFHFLIGCLIVTLPCVSAERTSHRVSPGVRKMAERLQQIVQAEDPMNNAFRNRERVTILEEAVRNEKEPGLVWEKLPRLAEEQMDAGNLAGALESLRLLMN